MKTKQSSSSRTSKLRRKQHGKMLQTTLNTGNLMAPATLVTKQHGLVITDQMVRKKPPKPKWTQEEIEKLLEPP